MNKNMKNKQVYNETMDQQDYTQTNEERRLFLLSKEEERIRDELEMEIERNLEGEFKDGIYNLALKLRRLYEQRREREEESLNVSMKKSKRVLEVNISIKMEGDTKIEINESKKEVDNKKTKKTEDSDKRKKFIASEDKTRKEKMVMKNQTKGGQDLRWKW